MLKKMEEKGFADKKRGYNERTVSFREMRSELAGAESWTLLLGAWTWKYKVVMASMATKHLSRGKRASID